ncbi:hypothetical protein AB0F71_35095 [Kitasatospora sp. NPDC028055]|uniref:hypothetical protein n=1 Tax=Kitasatospora sp. NPDC028055 TaxID=3155653 RepID=UPI0033C6D36E
MDESEQAWREVDAYFVDTLVPEEFGTLAGYSTTWLARAVGADDRLEATALQTVGSKGWDGFTVVRRVR